MLSRTAATSYRVGLDDGTTGVVYDFVQDTFDDFIKINGCYTGYGLSTVAAYVPSTGDLTGTWNTATSSWYTTTIGDSFSMTVAGGSTIQLRMTTETRGGLWSVAVDGGTPVDVSCYAPTTVTALATVATGLDPDIPHTVVGTFQGADPAHAPSAPPARGYLRSDVSGTIVGSVPGATPSVEVLSDLSNKELAFSVDYSGTVEWVPDHGVGTAFEIVAPTFIFDGAEVDVTAMAVGDSVLLDTFELRQHFYGELASVNVLEFHTTHAIDLGGLLTFRGSMVVLQSATISGYTMMLPAGTAADKFVTGLLNHHTNLADGSYTYFADERDAVSSGAVLSSSNADVIGAGRLINPRLSYRRGKTGTPPDGEQLFIWNRAANPKLYWQAMDLWPVVAGDALAWGFDLAVAEIADVRSMVA